jgi:hypothetical protein
MNDNANDIQRTELISLIKFDNIPVFKVVLGW